MPRKHRSQPAASVDERIADGNRSKNDDVPESPELSPAQYDEKTAPPRPRGSDLPSS